MIIATNYRNREIIKLLVISSLLALLFARPLGDLLALWWHNADYSHGFFVIPLSLYMVWQKREAWKDVVDKPSWAGLSIFCLSLIVYLGALLSRFHTLIFAAMIVLVLSLCLSFFGWKKSIFFLGPIMFLIFMFPIPSSTYILITNPLKLLITNISATIINFFGIPVLQQGNLLYFANTSLEVAEACSGIRSIYSYLMLGIVFSFFCGRMLSKAVLVLFPLPLAILVNIIRVTVTGILSHYFGANAAQGFFHEFTGMALFVVGLIFMLGAYYLVEKRSSKVEK